MNSERLHAIAIALRADIKAADVVNQLNQLVQSLTNVVNSPQTPTYQQQMSDAYASLLAALRSSKVNMFSPTWHQVLEEIGATNSVGNQLADRIAEIFARNQITPSIALQEVQQLETEARSLAESLAGITNSFAKLGIGKEDLEPGECEVGVLVPRLFVDNLLGGFAEELKDIDRILGVFSELTTGSRPGFEIKTISSSDLSVFLQMAPFVAAAVATAIERIVALYKNLLEVRKLQGQLTEQGVSKENLSGLENHANTIMTQGIEKLVKDILKEHKSTIDSGRKNELTIELRLALNAIATRIDRGFNIEVRMAEPERENEQDGTTDAETDKLFEQYAKIQDATKSMQFLRLEGEPILRLTDGKSKADNPSTT